MSKKVVLLLSVIAMLAVSCSDETLEGESLHDGASPLVIYASIDGTGKAATRATILENDDQWSYKDFTDEDVMGFYSSGGDWQVDQGKGDFNNRNLQYDAEKKQFHDPTDGVEFSPTNMNGSKIFMYFPYSADMNDDGLELRLKKEDNDTLRCVDFLSANEIKLDGVVDGKDIALYGSFHHAFSELIIMRGEGFDSPPPGKERITAVLNHPYTHIKADVSGSGDSWSCTPQLIYDGERLTEAEARQWHVWRGGNYSITGNDKDGKPAWYVIVPTLPGSNRSVVEYIELYDNEGNLLRVSALKLSGGNTKFVDPGWRYPMEITMKELVPTVNPYRVVPWNEDVDLTDERERGISSESDFSEWLKAYKAYLVAPDDEAQINALLHYGDSFVDEGGQSRSWHFYVLSDLNLAPYNNEAEGNVIIPKLNDVLDGISTTFVNGKFINHTIKGLSKTFIGMLEGNGSVQNIDFIVPDVRNDETSDSPAGIIVNEMTGTSVINCNIDNGTLYNPGGPAGMVAGKMNGGQVTNCTLSGFIAAKSTAPGEAANIVGTIEGSPTFSGNDADVVIDKEN